MLRVADVEGVVGCLRIGDALRIDHEHHAREDRAETNEQQDGHRGPAATLEHPSQLPLCCERVQLVDS